MLFLSCLMVAGACGSSRADEKGARALLLAGERLELTPAQRTEVGAIVARTAKEFNRVAREGGGSPDLSAKLDGIRKRSQETALALLTPGQRRLWENRAASGRRQPKPKTSAAEQMAARSLIIPTIEQLKSPPSRGAYGPSTALAQTQPHPARGDGYVILTDHENKMALEALKTLATYRKGEIIQVDSLGTLHESAEGFEVVQARLRKAAPRYVAIAPKAESYRENMHLCVMNLLAGLDDDPSLDAFPGYLMASDPQRLKGLIDRTIGYRAMARGEIDPVSIGAIEDTDARRYRSYQKAKVVQKMFAAEGIESPAIIVTTRKSHVERADFPPLPSASGNIAMLPDAERETFAKLSAAATDALNKNNVLFMFGHGTPGRICGAEVGAYAEIDFSGELVFCGSCLSASPYTSDRADLSKMKDNKRFAYHAIDNGAVMMLGHLGLCGGFPKVFPMAELVLDGLSIGEAYQRLMNGLIAGKPIPAYYGSASGDKAHAGAANNLLYIVWGDPALVPIRAHTDSQ